MRHTGWLVGLIWLVVAVGGVVTAEESLDKITQEVATDWRDYLEANLKSRRVKDLESMIATEFVEKAFYSGGGGPRWTVYYRLCDTLTLAVETGPLERIESAYLVLGKKTWITVPGVGNRHLFVRPIPLDKREALFDVPIRLPADVPEKNAFLKDLESLPAFPVPAPKPSPPPPAPKGG